MNIHAVRAIYFFEMHRWARTIVQSVAAPVITTSLYFIVFGAAIGSRMPTMNGVSYGAFIVPGLIMLSVLSESISNGSFGIHMTKFSGTIYEVLSAPVSAAELVLGYVGAATTKSLVLAALIAGTARLFVPYTIVHPILMVAFLVLGAFTFALFGLLCGIWARGWDQLAAVPMMVVVPLSFLGGSFYSLAALPGLWKHVALVNPIAYLIGGFRWAFYGVEDVPLGYCAAVGLALLAIGLAAVSRVLNVGWRLRA